MTETSRDYRTFGNVLEAMRERKATQDARDRAQDEQDAYAENERHEQEGR